MNLSVEFQTGPADQWHRWTVTPGLLDAQMAAEELLVDKKVHATALRWTEDAAAPHRPVWELR